MLLKKDIYQLFHFLVEKGANKEVIDEDKKTPLHYAAEKGHLPIVSFLIAKGANKKVIDEKGKTPLHYAIAKGHLTIVSLLN